MIDEESRYEKYQKARTDKLMYEILTPLDKQFNDKKALREELIKRGYERVKNVTLENYARKWEKIIDEALEKIK